MVTTQVKKSVNGSAGNIKLVKDVKKPVGTAKVIKPKTTAQRSSAVKEVEKKSEKIIATVNRSKLAAPQRKSVKMSPVVASSEKSRKLSQVPFLDKEKFKKPKLVRDSFTMPELEYAVLGAVKKVCLGAGIEVKKSQLLRIGLLLLSQTDLPKLKTLIAGLAPLKAGRPKKDK
jgi:hypothetical protein